MLTNMRARHITNTLLLAVVIGMSLLTPSFAAAPATDQDNVIAAMRTMYVAATHDDLAKFNTVAAPDFYAFDNGRRFTGDALMELIKGAHAAGKVYVWEVTEPEVHIDGDTAWITYTNRGSVQDQSGTKNLSWLESAVLRKVSGSWRIQFFHSTRVPSA
ncbi:nuclear transport factor 2 family protein [Dyella halodurans]|uniref:Nuclear transport factor 2 family protein n=1 Tax=Dyella halodurans TaxID=1920171 RepID=A0ABV9C8H8_9GAMM|nr:nuclear transport factor 2 family protein [Dyella halodurans]